MLWSLALIIKIVLAASLAPFGDEAWYWQESRMLDWAFSDLPPATAILIRCGETLFGHGVLAMRMPFLVLGALVPLVLTHVGRQCFGKRAGWSTGVLALGLPLLGSLGMFALPDVPLTLCSALALAALERALRRDRTRDWALLGLALAAAWLVHYRAAMLLLSGLVFFALMPRGRACWRYPGLWLALGIMLVGVLPLLIFNNEHHWVGLGFQLVERNPWSFHADALVQPFEQALVCTPLLYLAMLWAAWLCVRRAPTGAPWDLLACCALVPLITYFVVGCFADDTRLRIHWPLPGYLPLLIALPAAWQATTQESQTAARAIPYRRVLLAATLTVMVVGNLMLFAWLALAASPGSAAMLARWKVFPEHFVGWNEATQKTRELLSQAAWRDSILVADNFMLAAELDFALAGTRRVYSLDHPINVKHGRAPQLALWHRDEAALHDLAGHLVLLVVEPTARRERERAAWLDSLCNRVNALSPVATLDLYVGRKRYLFLRGVVNDSGAVMPGNQCAALQ